MKYEILLMARSWHQDYRWMIVPEYLPKSQLAVIQKLCWSDQVRLELRERGKLDIFPFYYIQLENAAVLLKFGETRYTDRWRRTITALQGICVKKEYSMYLRFALSWLVTVRADRLDTASKLNLEEADDYSYRTSGSHSFDMSYLNDLPFTQSEQTSEIRNDNHRFEFSKQGLDDLVTKISPFGATDLRNIQIAFGCATRDKEKFASFDYVAYL